MAGAKGKAGRKEKPYYPNRQAFNHDIRRPSQSFTQTKIARLGIVYYKSGKYQKAIAAYGEVIEQGQHLIKAYYNRGLAYFQLGMVTEALADLEMVLTLTDDPEIIENTRKLIELITDTY